MATAASRVDFGSIESYSLVLGSLGFVTGAASLVYARSTARATHRAADAADRARREAATMAVISTFQTAEFAEILMTLQRMEPTQGPDDFAGRPVEVRHSIALLSQRMEMLGVLVADRVISIELVERTLGTTVTLAWEKLGHGLEILREATGDRTAGEYFQWLAEQIAPRQRAHVPAYVALKDWAPDART